MLTIMLFFATILAVTAQFKSAFKNNYSVVTLINTALQNEPHLLYQMNFSYYDSTVETPFTLQEQVNMDVKMSNGKMYYAADSIIEIEGHQKHVSISLADSVIILSPKRDYSSLFQASLMDSIFEQAHVDSAATTENFTDSIGTVTFYFKPNSYYKEYILKYSLNSTYKFLPLQLIMTYVTSETDGIYGRVKIDFQNYSRNPGMNKNVFNEMQYVTLTINGYTANSPFTGFNVIDQTQPEQINN